MRMGLASHTVKQRLCGAGGVRTRQMGLEIVD